MELDPELARMYQERFPNDTVIVADAHQYLLDHYNEFDFIWSSPPCPTHSRVRHSQKNNSRFVPEYPDMKLYQEILFLDNHFKGKWIVENVIPYYEPLIKAQKRERHLYWCNFTLPAILSKRHSVHISNNKSNQKTSKQLIDGLCEFHKIDLSSYKGEQRALKIARNLVDYEAGKTIFNTAFGIIEANNQKQLSMF